MKNRVFRTSPAADSEPNPGEQGLKHQKTIAYSFFKALLVSLFQILSKWWRWCVTQAISLDWSFDCCLCHEPDKNGALCASCQQLLVRNSQPCRLCACPLNGSTEDICEACSIIMPPFTSAIVPFLYRFPADQLVIQLKFHDSPGMARVMAGLMAQAVTADLKRKNRTASSIMDYLVPVPLFPARFRQRGFNQSMQLAHGLSLQLGIPVHPTALLRSSSRGLTGRAVRQQSQTARDRQARLASLEPVRSLEGQSSIHAGFRSADVTGLNLLLVDDVMTTGATLIAASEALLAAGARSVCVCAFARTPL